MKCEKMHAVISVRQCLSNQTAKAGLVGGRNLTASRYPGCNGCETGAEARAGKLNDDDLQAILDGLRNRANPPQETLPEPVTSESKKTGRAAPAIAQQGPKPTSTKEETVREPIIEEVNTKQCKLCHEVKPLSEFPLNNKNKKDGRHAHCLACNRVKQAKYYGKTKQKLAPSPLTPDASSLEKRTEPIPATEIAAPPAPRNEHRLVLDFSRYPEVLDEIKHLADEEERPPEVQARLMLRRLLTPWSQKTAAIRELAERYNPRYLGVDKARGKDKTVYQPMFIDAEPEAECA